MTETLERTEEATKHRLTLDVSPAMKREIEELARVSGTTQANVLRLAVALLKTIKEAQAGGQAPALIDKEGNVTARLVGI